MNRKLIEQRFSFISGAMGLLSIALCICAGVLLLVQSAPSLIMSIFVTAGFLFCVNLVVPGIALLLGRANLAYAWLRGRNPLGYANVPWEELSRDKQRSIHIESALSFFMVIAYIVWLVTN